MKNVFVLAACIAGSCLTSFANNTNTSVTAVIEWQQEKEYKKIEPSQVSPEALRQIGTKYGGYAIKEAYVAKDGEYKLILSKDDVTVTAFFTASGEFIKES